MGLVLVRTEKCIPKYIIFPSKICDYIMWSCSLGPAYIHCTGVQCTLHCTDVRFANPLSAGFTTVAVINPPENKLENRTSVHWKKVNYPNKVVQGTFCSVYTIAFTSTFDIYFLCFYQKKKTYLRIKWESYKYIFIGLEFQHKLWSTQMSYWVG